MMSRLTYSLVSWASAVLLIVYYAWVSVVPGGYGGAPVAVLIMSVLVMATLRLGVRSVPSWWEVADGSQIKRITFLIILGIVVQLVVGGALRAVERFDWFISSIVFLCVWTSVPAIFLSIRLVRWPRRVASPSLKQFAPVAMLALLVAAGTGYLGSIAYDGPRGSPPVDQLLMGATAVLLGATMEEIVFRVLLLTALVSATGSRMQALIISSAAFALFHIPGFISVPLMAGEWTEIGTYAYTFLPELVWTIGAGFLFGALWLRTGSIALISIAHALCNLGPIAVGGLNGL